MQSFPSTLYISSTSVLTMLLSQDPQTDFFFFEAGLT